MDTDQHNSFTLKKVAVWAITSNGRRLGKQITQNIPGSTLFLNDRFQQDCDSKDSPAHFFSSLSDKVRQQFAKFDSHIFICATGIIIRIIAPLIVSKLSDPAVVALDDKGEFVISLLSGHIGGANELAKDVSKITGGKPVITTATDKNKKPAIDLVAKDLGLVIETPENIKHINMAFLEGRTISIADESQVLSGSIPQDFFKQAVLEEKKPDLFCSYRTAHVPRETLILRPKILCAGIGCNRGTSKKEIIKFLIKTFAQAKLSLHSIKTIATSDVKKDEQGLTSMAEELNLDISYYNKEELNSVEAVENPSAMARKHLGLNSVSEAAAILASGHGRLILPKTKNKDVTLAVAVMK